MGKNQAHKAMQRAKMGSHASAGPGEEEVNDGMMDGSFHSPEWHAARLASLQTSHTITWEEFKNKQREEARKKEQLEGDEERRMREYRAQLDAERASKLARGRNHAGLAQKKDKKKSKKEKDRDESKPDKKRKRKEKERRRKRRGDDSETDTQTSDSEDDKDRKKERRKSKKDKKVKRKKKHSDSESSSDSTDTEKGPVRLSAFFNND